MTLPLIGITSGDPAGIGPELCLRLLNEHAVLKVCIPVVLGDASILKRVASHCSLSEPSRIISLDQWKQNPKIEVPTVVDCSSIDSDTVLPGKVDANCGRAAYTYIEQSIEGLLSGRLKAVSTGPIHKKSLNLAGIPFPGHTEIFTSLTKADRTCMMLYSDKLSITFVTTHVGYADVPKRLSVKRILDVIELTHDAMTVLGKRKPKLSVCGLNPHAGDHGLFGYLEEESLIEPALITARKKGLKVDGPISPDAAFIPGFYQKTDAIICMYHDQGHIPFKAISFDTGVNVTLGLPIVRTSVDHGTAFDIAWRGVASPRGFIEAILLAARLLPHTPSP